MGWVGGWDGNVPCTEHITCIHARGGWGILAEHITCIHARGGWGGWGGMITCLALAHIQAEHITCTHASGGWGGWGGWGGLDDTVQRLGQLSLASPKIRQGNSFKGKDSPSPSRDGLFSSCSDKHGLLVKTVYFPFLYAPPFPPFFACLHFTFAPRSLGHNLVVFYGSPIHGKKTAVPRQKHPFHGNKQGFHGLSTVPLGCEHMKHLRVWPTGRFQERKKTGDKENSCYTKTVYCPVEEG